jgi:RDD family protein
MSKEQDYPETVRSRVKHLKNLWDEISRPISLPLSAILWLSAHYKYIVGLGTISFSVLLLGAASLFVLLVPAGFTRLFALRIISFCIDFGMLAVITLAGLLVYRGGHGSPTEIVLTLVAWAWFSYFVFFDWRLRGTLGKRLLGLSLVSRRGELTVSRSFIRTFLSLAVPLIVITKLDAHLSTDSRSAFLSGFCLREALLLLNPISIIVLGGHRGLVDRVTNTEIVYEQRETDQRPAVSLKHWVLVCGVPIVYGLVLSMTFYVSVGGSSFFDFLNRPSQIRLPPKPTGSGMTETWFWQEVETSAALWARLPLGIRNPSDVIEAINIDTLSRNPFDGEDTTIFLQTEDIQTLKKLRGIPVLRISVTPWTSPAVYGVIARNLSEYEAQSMSPNERRLTVIEFEQQDDYGVVAFRQEQNTLLGVQRIDPAITWNLTDISPRGQIGIAWSLDMGGLALLGDGATREVFKHQGFF